MGRLDSSSMPLVEIPLDSEKATRTLGAQLAAVLENGDAICLSGPLGAGKSTLARGLIQHLSPGSEAPSPTFTFVETYECETFILRHFDFYRLEQPDEVWELGYEDALDGGVALIEWPEKIGEHAPSNALSICFQMEKGRRGVRIEGNENWISRLKAAGIA